MESNIQHLIGEYYFVVLPKDTEEIQLTEYKLDYLVDHNWNRIDLYESGATGKSFELIGLLGEIIKNLA